MAREISVRQLSGSDGSFQMLTDMTVREFKRQLHGWLPCADESKRNMSSVEVVVGDTWLSLGNILHFCLLRFSGKSPLNC